MGSSKATKKPTEQIDRGIALHLHAYRITSESLTLVSEHKLGKHDR